LPPNTYFFENSANSVFRTRNLWHRNPSLYQNGAAIS